MNRKNGTWILAAGAFLLLPASSLRALSWGDSVATGTLSLGADLVNTTAASGPAIVITGDGVTIDLCGRTIDGLGAGSGIDIGAHGGIVVKNGVIRDVAGAAVRIDGSTVTVGEIILENLEISGSGVDDAAAIRAIGDINGLLIQYCSVHDNPQGAILTGPMGLSAIGLVSLFLQNNEIFGNGDGTPLVGGTAVDPLYHGTITLCPVIYPNIQFNHIHDNHEVEAPSAPAVGAPAYLGYPALFFCDPSVDPYITDNDIHDNAYGGIVVEAATAGQVQNNNLNSNGCSNPDDYEIGVDFQGASWTAFGNWWGDPAGPMFSACPSTSGLANGMDDDVPLSSPIPTPFAGPQFLSCGPTITPIAIDIEPNSSKNCINTGSKQLVKVAILGSATFDVTQVDPTSVFVLGTNPTTSRIEDVNGDRKPDMLFFLRGREIVPDCGASTAALTAQSLNGDLLFTGSDRICWLGPMCP